MHGRENHEDISMKVRHIYLLYMRFHLLMWILEKNYQQLEAIITILPKGRNEKVDLLFNI